LIFLAKTAVSEHFRGYRNQGARPQGLERFERFEPASSLFIVRKS
jgi:hypothetical protein